jgi:16S rRNA (adenine1518-N6/adenine1519-N6)-dimethyltransferase
LIAFFGMLRARKRFGQHFLHDPGVIGRIIAATAPEPDDFLVEIGPGLGALTLPLLERVKALHVVEIDRDAIRHLRSAAAGRGELHIHEGDVLEFDFAQLPGDRPMRLVGNLPYNISTPLLFHLLRYRGLIRDMHFMLQKEVVDRMAARPGADDYGRLTVMLAPWLQVEPLFEIGPGAFHPPPKVVSTVVRLTPHQQPPFAIEDPKRYAQVVAAAFAQRRKTLRNALKPLLDAEQIAAAGVDPGLRAEVLPPAKFESLARRVAVRDASRDSPHL